jgi:hypothetical protein
MALSAPVSILTGGPGTGKTHTLRPWSLHLTPVRVAVTASGGDMRCRLHGDKITPVAHPARASPPRRASEAGTDRITP